VSYRLYDYLPSGNGYKVRLVLRQLGLPYELVELDIKRGATRTPEFLAKNPNGRIRCSRSRVRIPVGKPRDHLVPRGGGRGSCPGPARARAHVQWMCFEQYNSEPSIGTARFWIASLGRTEGELGEKLEEKRRNGHAALAVLERGLDGRAYLAGDRYSLADIALYAYTHVAPEGGFSSMRIPRSVRGAPAWPRSPGTSRSPHGRAAKPA